jgi:hypothetical protein
VTPLWHAGCRPICRMPDAGEEAGAGGQDSGCLA